MAKRPRPPAPIGPGGNVAGTCQFPTAVVVHRGNYMCSGVLVHPEVVLTAAHCISGVSNILFGEDLRQGEHEIRPTTCRGHPNFAGRPGEWDFGFCTLPQPITDIPITPPAVGCVAEALQPGREVAIAGFGTDVWGGPSGPKKWAMTTVSEPFNGRYVVAGDEQAAACMGDSGGPAYVQADDGSWQVWGILSGSPNGKCGGWAWYGLLAMAVEWIEESSGVDITPCTDGAGNWDPGSDCGGFATEPRMEGATWPTWCDVQPVIGYSSACGEPFASDPGDTSTGDGESSDGGTSGDGAGTGDGETDAPGGPDDTADTAGTGTGFDPSSNDEDRDGGCTCAAAGAGGPMPLFALALLGFARRRPRCR